MTRRSPSWPGRRAARSRARWLSTVAGTAALSVLSATGAALAHSGHETHTAASAASGGGPGIAVPVALLVGGGLVLGTSVYLERADELDGRLADVGVLLGVLGLMAGVILALV